MMGPPIGGFLHGIAGMALPLLVCSILVLVSLPSLFWSMVNMKEPVSDDDEAEVEETRSNHSVSDELTVASLVNVSTVNSSFVTFVAAIGFGFISPVAAPHFRDVLSKDIGAGSIGLLLAIPAFLYAIFSPLSGIFAESYGCKQTMFCPWCSLASVLHLLLCLPSQTCKSLWNPWALRLPTLSLVTSMGYTALERLRDRSWRV